MEALGSVSQIYMFILLALLFIGSGLAVWSFLNFLVDKTTGKSGSVKKEKQVILNNGPNQQQGPIKKTYGGFIMVNNGWLKLAVFSFVGIIASVIILGFISTTTPVNAASNTHLQHQQQGMSQSGYSQDGMNTNSQMGNMQMQGDVNGNMGAQMQGNMNGNMGAQMQGNMNGNMGQQNGNEYMMMQQQLYQMQMQLNQMQQQQIGMPYGNMNGNMQSQSGGMSNMPQSSSGMGMGMMPMMNMGGSMSSMSQNNSSMSSMPQSSSGSGGGMGMM